MAIFRPDPKAEKRWIFNILHFLVGLIAHLSAGTTTDRNLGYEGYENLLIIYVGNMMAVFKQYRVIN